MEINELSNCLSRYIDERFNSVCLEQSLHMRQNRIEILRSYTIDAEIAESYIPDTLEQLLLLYAVADKRNEQDLYNIFRLPIIQGWLNNWNIVITPCYFDIVGRILENFENKFFFQELSMEYSKFTNSFAYNVLYNEKEFIYHESIWCEREVICEHYLNSLAQQSKFKKYRELGEYIAKNIKKKYLKLPSLDEVDFSNLFEYWALLFYEQNNHILYEQAEKDLEDEIYIELSKLNLCDLALLYVDKSDFWDCIGIYFTDEVKLSEIDKELKNTHHFYHFLIIYDMKSYFYELIPNYDPVDGILYEENMK